MSGVLTGPLCHFPVGGGVGGGVRCLLSNPTPILFSHCPKVISIPPSWLTAVPWVDLLWADLARAPACCLPPALPHTGLAQPAGSLLYTPQSNPCMASLQP